MRNIHKLQAYLKTQRANWRGSEPELTNSKVCTTQLPSPWTSCGSVKYSVSTPSLFNVDNFFADNSSHVSAVMARRRNALSDEAFVEAPSRLFLSLSTHITNLWRRVGPWYITWRPRLPKSTLTPIDRSGNNNGNLIGSIMLVVLDWKLDKSEWRNGIDDVGILFSKANDVNDENRLRSVAVEVLSNIWKW